MDNNDRVDVFIHAQKFETHKDRRTAKHGGLQEGDNIETVIKPPGPKISSFEAWRCAIVDAAGVVEKQNKRMRRGGEEEDDPETEAVSGHGEATAA